MATLNIACPDDPSYRYKMPPVDPKHESSGNGKKTAIINIDIIAKSLYKPVEYLVKYLGQELGTSSEYNIDRKVCIIKGTHDQATLQKVIFRFISEWVLCSECKNPETQIYLKFKTKTKTHKAKVYCKSCSANYNTDTQLK